MNRELIIDALEYLDADIIEETDSLRLKKRTHRKASVKINWKQIALVAAAVCLVIIGVTLLRPVEGRKDAAFENADDPFAEDAFMENNADKLKSGDMLVRIDEWQEDGFYGTVIQNGDKGHAPKGACIKVEFSSDIVIDMEGAENFTYNNNANECGIKEGTVVTVAYTGIEKNDNTAEKPDDAGVSGVLGSNNMVNGSYVTYTIRASSILEEDAYRE